MKENLAVRGPHGTCWISLLLCVAGVSLCQLHADGEVTVEYVPPNLANGIGALVNQKFGTHPKEPGLVPEFRAFCRHHSMVMMSANQAHQDEPAIVAEARKLGVPPNIVTYGESYGGAFVLLAMRRVQEQNIPMGVIAGALKARRSKYMPTDQGSHDVESKYPIVHMYGTVDGGYDYVERMWILHRQKYGALWCWYPEWKIGHGWNQVEDHAFLLPYFHACIKARCDASGKLKSLDEKSGWRGEVLPPWADKLPKILPSAEYKGAPEKTWWFPDKTIAHIWQSAYPSRRVAKITSPTQWAECRPGQDVLVTIEITDAAVTSQIEEIVLCANGEPLAKLPGTGAAKYEYVWKAAPRDIHSLTAIATIKGEPVAAVPVTFFVHQEIEEGGKQESQRGSP
jgi:hypothetical protein